MRIKNEVVCVLWNVRLVPLATWLQLGCEKAETCRELWQSLPPDCRKRALCYSNFWDAYAALLTSKRHRAVGKETGETAHIEQFNNTSRQRCAKLVRKTLS